MAKKSDCKRKECESDMFLTMVICRHQIMLRADGSLSMRPVSSTKAPTTRQCSLLAKPSHGRARECRCVYVCALSKGRYMMVAVSVALLSPTPTGTACGSISLCPTGLEF